MEKPWKSPPASGGPSITSSALLPMQMTCSTPLHFSLGMTLSPEPTSAATTRLSLDLFYKNGFKSHMEQPSRPSLTTGWFSCEKIVLEIFRNLHYYSRFRSVGFEEQFFHVISVITDL